ncbi:MAG: agmatinase [Oceanospirillaceae bacterium]
MDTINQPVELDEFSNIDLAVTRDNYYGTIGEPVYSGVLSFMRRKYSKDLTGVDVAVVGVPFDLSVTNRPGARFGPRAIREASAQLAWGKAWGWGVDPFDKLSVVDWGDCLFDPGRPAEIPAVLERQFSQILAQDVATLAIGGDHFVTYPILQAHAKKHGKLALIHFDAHCDTWRDDEGRIDHGTMFFHAAQQGIIDPQSSAQIGIRTHNSETHGFNIFDADLVRKLGVPEIIKRVRQVVGDNPCYLTFDIDCLDPSCAPGTGTPVVGGMQTAEALELLRGLAGINIVGMDLVEVSPSYDVGQITSLAGATIALNLLCLFAAAQTRNEPITAVSK